MEVNVALDTNAYSDFMRGDAARVEIVRAADSISMPLIVLAEIRAGLAAGSQESANAANLQRFLSSPRLSVLAPDDLTTHHYAQLYLQLRNKGAFIPTDDLWIASLAVQHSLVLCTSDRHFQWLPQVVTC